LAPPVQGQIRIRAPEEALGASRHLLPYTVSWLLDVAVQVWLAPRNRPSSRKGLQ
jgi:hypothetical protein